MTVPPIVASKLSRTAPVAVRPRFPPPAVSVWVDPGVTVARVWPQGPVTCVFVVSGLVIAIGVTGGDVDLAWPTRLGTGSGTTCQSVARAIVARVVDLIALAPYVACPRVTRSREDVEDGHSRTDTHSNRGSKEPPSAQLPSRGTSTRNGDEVGRGETNARNLIGPQRHRTPSSSRDERTP
jgi:hypothetical protein